MREEVVDSNVFLRSFLEEKGKPGYQQAIKLLEDLNRGKCIVHISMLVVVEVCAAVRRRASLPGKTYEARGKAYEAQKTLKQWVEQGKIRLYELNETRMDDATKIAINDKLKGPDAVIAQISKEMNLPLRTYDGKLKERFQGIKLDD